MAETCPFVSSILHAALSLWGHHVVAEVKVRPRMAALDDTPRGPTPMDGITASGLATQREYARAYRLHWSAAMRPSIRIIAILTLALVHVLLALVLIALLYISFSGSSKKESRSPHSRNQGRTT